MFSKLNVLRFTTDPAGLVVLFDKIFVNWIGVTSSCVGLNINKKFESSILQRFLFSMNFTFLWLIIYTMTFYDFETMLQASAFLGITAQGDTKYRQVIENHHLMRKSIHFLQNVVKENPRAFEKCLPISAYITVAVTLTYVATGIMFITLPLVVYYYSNEVINMIPVYVPFIDDRSYIGYALTSAIHVIQIYCGAFGVSTVDLLLVNTLVNTWGAVDVFKRKIEQLSDATGPGHSLSDWEIKIHLKNVIIMHQELREQMIRIKNSFEYICTFQFGSAVIAMVVLIFAFVSHFWIVGGLFFVATFIQLLSFSCVGTLTEILNDRIYEAINSCKWYQFRISEQKSVKLMVLVGQSYITMKIGKVYPMSLNTFIQVMRGIYSLTMMLMTTTN